MVGKDCCFIAGGAFKRGTAITTKSAKKTNEQSFELVLFYVTITSIPQSDVPPSTKCSINMDE